MEREIRGGEVHVFPVEIERGQFLRILLDENGIDLEARLIDPDETFLAGADSPGTGRTEVIEDLSVLAEKTGSHRLEVRAPGKGSGRYSLRIEDPKAPSETDRTRAEAARVLWDGLHSKSEENQIQSLERALNLWRRAGDLEKSAEVLFALGIKRLEVLKIYDQALADFQEVAQYWSRGSTRRSMVFQAESLTYVGRCLTHFERRKEAREAHDWALALSREVGQRVLQAKNLNLLGRLDTEEGEVRKGFNRHIEARDLAREVGDQEEEARILNNLAYDHEQLGEMQQALELYQQALNLTSKPDAKAIYRNNLGETYRALGDWEKAFDYFRLAAELSDSLRDRTTAGKILINLARTYRRRGQLAEARNSLDRALDIKAREIQTFALGNLAFLLLQLRQPEQAVKFASEAVDLGGSLEEETFTRYALGSAFRDLGDTDSARRELVKALDLATRRGDHGREAELNLVLARMDRNSGDLTSALSRVQFAIDLIERWRGQMVDLELKNSFLASTQDVYELQVNILMALHEQRPTERFAEEALRVSEQARARGLLEILTEAGTDIRQGVDPVLIEREQEAREVVNLRDSHRRQLRAQRNPDPGALAEAERKLDEAVEAHNKVQVDLRQGSPQYAALTHPEPSDAEEIRQVLDGEAILLEYFLGAERSFLWVVTPASAEGFELPGREEIEKRARRYYELLTERNRRIPGESVQAWRKRFAEADAEAEIVARELSKLILGPVEELLGDRTLLIVSDGALRYIPFAALPILATGEPLASRHVIVNLPSASVLAVLRHELHGRPRAPRALAIFADPVFEGDDARLRQRAPGQEGEGEANREAIPAISDFRRLPYSQREAHAIAALLPADEVFKAMGFDASRAAVTNGKLVDYRTVHFATHGILSSDYPGLSGLALSFYSERGEYEDGFLRLNDIYNLRFGADLVVLSACETALGKEIRGEGLIGLTRGFMYAGAARVLASLWSVQDLATADLMESFYRGMFRDGLSPAAALRKAQLEMVQKAGRKSPYYWAGFSLQGEWR